MFNGVTYNGQGFVGVAVFEKRPPITKAENTVVSQFMQKADSNPSDGASAECEPKAEVTTSSSNDTKPLVVGSQTSYTIKNRSDGEPFPNTCSEMELEINTDLKQKTIDVINVVNGLTPIEIEKVLDSVRYSVINSSTAISYCHNNDSILNGHRNPNLISSCQ